MIQSVFFQSRQVYTSLESDLNEVQNDPYCHLVQCKTLQSIPWSQETEDQVQYITKEAIKKESSDESFNKYHCPHILHSTMAIQC